MKSRILLPVICGGLFCFSVRLPAAELTLPNISYPASEVLNLWPGTAPGETGNIGPEHILTDRPRAFDQITDVSVPTLSVFLPAAEKRNGTAMLVIPGGGLDRLAIETEGYEIAEWLNEHGIAAFMLKYRVPARSRDQRWKVGLQDAQRAMGLIRQRAAEWHVDDDAIGAIGFSAGGEINVMLSVYWNEARQYPPVDAADNLSTRPDFNICMYGGGFTNFAASALREDIASRINPRTPPMFISQAFDDQALASVVLMGALKRANIPSEIHLYAAGAHGFGVRDSGLPINQWREECLTWLAWQGYLDSAAVRSYAKLFVRARDTDAANLPKFSSAVRSGTLPQAFAVQRRVVSAAISHGAVIAGYQAASLARRESQKANGEMPAAFGVLFKSGRIEASATTSIAFDPKHPALVETGIGYIVANDIGTKLRVPRQALTTIEGIVPVVELPEDLAPRLGGKVNELDAVAVNVGSSRYIVGATIAPKEIGNPDAVTVVLQRDGKQLHATGAGAQDGQARTLMAVINQIVEQGRVIHRGDIIVCGAPGGAKPAEKGGYVADFGKLGVIKFKIE